MCYQHQPTANFFGFCWQKSQLHEQISRFTQSRVLFPIKKRWPAVGRMRLQVAFKSFSPTTRAMRRSSDREASANRFPSASWKPIIRSKGSCTEIQRYWTRIGKNMSHLQKVFSTENFMACKRVHCRLNLDSFKSWNLWRSHVLDHHNSCERCWVIMALGFSQLGIAKRFARGGNHLARSYI